MVSKELLKILVCPKCHGKLVYKKEELICHSCLLAYRIEDDIPVMLIDEARKITKPTRKKTRPKQ